MPKTAVDEDGDLLGAEEKVWMPRHIDRVQ
jgi:hypothetical protein